MKQLNFFPHFLPFFLTFVGLFPASKSMEQTTFSISIPTTINPSSLFTASALISNAPSNGEKTYNVTINCPTPCSPLSLSCIINLDNGVTSGSCPLTFTAPSTGTSLTLTGTALGNNGDGCEPTACAATSNTALLPVELTFFKAELSSGRTKLLWETASETNNEAFVVEHSQDGRPFWEIGKIAGAGTSTETHHYFFLHEHPATGYNYYRLKQVDFDGNFEYSPVRAVLFGSKNSVQVSPTVTRNFAEVFLQEEAEEAVQVSVFSQMGMLISRQEFNSSSTLSLDLSNFPPGQYVVKVLVGRDVSNFRLVKID